MPTSQFLPFGTGSGAGPNTFTPSASQTIRSGVQFPSMSATATANSPESLSTAGPNGSSPEKVCR